MDESAIHGKKKEGGYILSCQGAKFIKGGNPSYSTAKPAWYLGAFACHTFLVYYPSVRVSAKGIHWQRIAKWYQRRFNV